jgi:Bacterial Ig-like domain (group 2)
MTRILGNRSVALYILMPMALLAQQPSLKIISPADKTVVHPGETLTVEIEATGSFVAIIVFTNNPFPWSETATQPPYKFTLSIPNDIDLGRYKIVANGSTKSYGVIESKPVELDVERADKPVKIITDPGGPLILRPGGKLVLDVGGTYKDGSYLILNDTGDVQFSSENPDIATIKQSGAIDALKKGTTYFIVRVYGQVLRVKVVVDDQTAYR